MINRFLDLIWPNFNKEARFSVFSLFGPHGNKSSKIRHFSLDNRDDLISWIEKGVANEEDMYCGTCAYKKGILGGRGTENDVVGMPGLWLDLDIQNSTAHKSTGQPPDLESAVRVIDDFGYPPTMVVFSGHGLHVWWLFDEPEWFDSKDVKRYRRLSNNFQSAFRRHMSSRGYDKLDDTADLARILRIPGTFNFKNKNNIVFVDLLVDDGPRYSFEDLEQKFSSSVKETDEVSSDSDISDVIRRLENIKKPGSKVLANRILSGRSLAREGNRDNELQRAASLVAFASIGLKVSAEDLTELLRPSVEAMQKETSTTESPAPTIKDAYDKVTRALKDAAQAEKDQKDKELRILETLAKSVRDEGFYSKEDIERFAETQKCSVEDLNNRWVIQIGNAYYPFSEGYYTGPYIKDAMTNHLRKMLMPLAPFGVQLEVLGRDGAVRKLNLVELIERYGTLANKSIASLALQNSYYDPNTKIFYEAVCPLDLKIKPLYDESVNIWLNKLGGKHSDKLLDWLATVHLLDTPTSALYLSGKKGAGKSMLSQAIAQLWGANAPTEYGNLDSFNADIARCPLVVADEHIPNNGGRRSTAEFRDVIAKTSRTLRRKFLPNMDLMGCIRLMLLSNDDHMLEFGAEDFSNDALSATYDRILHIEVTEEPSEYLRSIGGMYGTREWIADKKLASHIKWLMENRQVKRDNRFLVTGNQTKVHRGLATQGGLRSTVCEWIAKLFTLPDAALNARKGVFIGNGILAVNTMAVKDSWPDENRVPSVTAIGRALSNISKGATQGLFKDDKNVRYHIINLDILLEWIFENQAGDTAAILTKVNAPHEGKVLFMSDRPLTVV